jgi:hypothetical protein
MEEYERRFVSKRRRQKKGRTATHKVLLKVVLLTTSANAPACSSAELFLHRFAESVKAQSVQPACVAVKYSAPLHSHASHESVPDQNGSECLPIDYGLIVLKGVVGDVEIECSSHHIDEDCTTARGAAPIERVVLN